MTSRFVSQLRTREEALQLAPAGTTGVTVRVESPETWDTIKAIVSLDEPVRTLKGRALEILFPLGAQSGDYVLKLRGWEVLDENVSIAAAGATDGSIFLLTQRRKRPVR